VIRTRPQFSIPPLRGIEIPIPILLILCILSNMRLCLVSGLCQWPCGGADRLDIRVEEAVRICCENHSKSLRTSRRPVLASPRLSRRPTVCRLHEWAASASGAPRPAAAEPVQNQCLPLHAAIGPAADSASGHRGGSALVLHTDPCPARRFPGWHSPCRAGKAVP